MCVKERVFNFVHLIARSGPPTSRDHIESNRRRRHRRLRILLTPSAHPLKHAHFNDN